MEEKTPDEQFKNTTNIATKDSEELTDIIIKRLRSESDNKNFAPDLYLLKIIHDHGQFISWLTQQVLAIQLQPSKKSE